MLAYFGHHKCASRWISEILWRVAGEAGLNTFGVYDADTPFRAGVLQQTAPHAVPFDRAQLRQRVDAARAHLVGCLTADRLQAEILRPSRAFHVIRDPRDIIVSAYFSHRNSHTTDGFPHIQAHRDALTGTSLEQGLLLEIDFSQTLLHQLGDWDYAQPSILELKMEELTLDPYGGFLRIFRHLGLLSDVDPAVANEQLKVWLARLRNRLARRRWLGGLRRRMPATGEMVLGAVYAQRFEAKSGGRERGTEDRTSHYRKGISGDWANYFTRRHAEAFDTLFGELLVRLGYEDGSEWIERV